MKRLIGVLLCLMLACFVLVGCAEDVIGEDLKNYTGNTVADDKIEKLNFYIITGDTTADEAKTTVPQNINAYLKEKYEIILNIVYLTEAEYDAKVQEALSKQNESERPDIVLIRGKDMFDTLHSDDRLVLLNNLYNSRDFRKLNAIVDDVLLSASTLTGELGSVEYYTVPNNHVIGEYEYIVIDKEMARDILKFSNSALESMTTEESLQPLLEAIANYHDSEITDSTLAKDEYIGQFVKIVRGSFADKALLENDGNCLVNIKAFPNATYDEAFLSAFGIVKHLNDKGSANTEEEQAILDSHYAKCMKIIYALNTDAYFVNMLQYGYVGTNYKIDPNEPSGNYINLVKGLEVTYDMNPIYVGNSFISYYCKEIGWTSEVYTNILKQNADANTPMSKLSIEANAISLVDYATAETALTLPKYGSTYSDVSVTWSVDNPAAYIDNGILRFIPSAESSTKVTVTATLICDTGTSTVEITKDFLIIIEKAA